MYGREDHSRSGIFQLHFIPHKEELYFPIDPPRYFIGIGVRVIFFQVYKKGGLISSTHRCQDGPEAKLTGKSEKKKSYF